MAPGAGKRTDVASRVIEAPPGAVYRALTEPEAVAAWRAPEGIRMRILAFEPRVGGRFRLALEHTEAGHSVPGKTSARADVVEGRFVELVPDARVVEAVKFVSDDPAFAGEMRITTTLRAALGGTEVNIRCEDVPHGIGAEDHAVGLASTLANLAAFVERAEEDMAIVGIWINCPDAAVSDAIAADLLARRLVACANRYPGIASRYHWKGQVEEATEVPLLVKTRAELFDAVAAAVRALHPYETPAVYAVEVVAATEDYRDWVLAETEPATKSWTQAGRSR